MFEAWTDAETDRLLCDLAQAFSSRAEQLAIATVLETGLGNVADKTIRNRFASLMVCESLVGQIAQGQLSYDAERRVWEVASPVGIVFAVVPVTNPVATAVVQDADQHQGP